MLRSRTSHPLFVALALLAASCTGAHPASLVVHAAATGSDGAMLLAGVRASEHTSHEGGRSSPITFTPWIARVGDDRAGLAWSVLLDAEAELHAIAERSDGTLVVSGASTRDETTALLVGWIRPDGVPIRVRELGLGSLVISSSSVVPMDDGDLVAVGTRDQTVLVRLDDAGAAEWSVSVHGLSHVRTLPGPDGAAIVVGQAAHGASVLVITLDRSGGQVGAHELLIGPDVRLMAIDAARASDGALVIAAQSSLRSPYDADLVLARMGATGELDWAFAVDRHTDSHAHEVPSGLAARLAVAPDGTLHVATAIHRGRDGADLALLQIDAAGATIRQRALDAAKLAIPQHLALVGGDVVVTGLDAFGVGHTRWVFGPDSATGCGSRTWDPALSRLDVALTARGTTVTSSPFSVTSERSLPLTAHAPELPAPPLCVPHAS